MKYTVLTTKLIGFVEAAKPLLKSIEDFNQHLAMSDPLDKKSTIMQEINSWFFQISATLKKEELLLEELRLNNIMGNATVFSIKQAFHGLKDEEVKVRQIIEELLKIAENIELGNSKKEISLVKIEEIDCFKDIIKNVNIDELKGKYDTSVFLEDDVENTFINLIGESQNYKEMDSGAEMRDLFTDRIFINGKRYATSIMFKGRGINGELKISNCGIGGNQLLKLAKNTSSELFIVQHVNKINTDVREALYDHLKTHSAYPKIKICFIDGLDTARILKGTGANLDELVAKKSSAGRKKKEEDNVK